MEGFDVGVAELRGDFKADVKELADVGVVERVALVVAQGTGVLLAGPAVDGFSGGEFVEIDIDDGGVWLAEGFFFGEGFSVDLLREFEAGAAGFGEADDFFKPVGACGFDVESCTGAGEGALDGRVDGELVRAGVDGEFQSSWEAVGFNRVGDDGEVVVEFFFELGDIADVIDAFVEAASEFRGDGLDRDALIRNGGEDDEKLWWGLRAVSFIHGNFGYEIRAFGCDDVVVDRSGFLGGFEELVGGFLDVFTGDFERLIDAGDGDGADELWVLFDESCYVCRICGFADVVCDIEGEEITRSDETVDRAEIDMVGVEEVFASPAEVGDGLVRGVARGLWLGADDVVLAVGFVPNWADIDAELFGGDEGVELGVRAVGEAIADSESVFGAKFHFGYLLEVICYFWRRNRA